MRNEAAFLWASIPDNGGIRSGFLPYLSKNCYRSVRLDFHRFSKVLDQIDLLAPDSRKDVLAKKRSTRFCDAIQGLVDERVIEGMLSQPMQAARRIEFCLDGDLRISDSDVKTVHVPNTYKHFLSPKTAKFEPSKIIYYNPKNSVLSL